MSGYSKLWSEIITSSIWSQDDKTRIVWVTILALKDQHGYIPASIPGLANASRVSVEDCEKAIAILEAPDKYSRSTEHEGRRIEKVDGGWLVLNHHKYRDKKGIASDPTAAERQARYRERHGSNGSVTESNGCVTVSNGSVTESNGVTALRNVTPVSVYGICIEEKRVQGEEKKKREPFRPPSVDDVKAYCIEIGASVDAQKFCDSYESKGWMSGRTKIANWKACVRTWVKNQKEWGTPNSYSAPKLIHIPDTRKYTCPRCGMTGTANDAIPARDGEYDPIEYHGKYCCGCWTDPYKTEVNHKSRKFDKGQLVELK